jgi:hypothetical protein
MFILPLLDWLDGPEASLPVFPPDDELEREWLLNLSLETLNTLNDLLSDAARGSHPNPMRERRKQPATIISRPYHPEWSEALRPWLRRLIA